MAETSALTQHMRQLVKRFDGPVDTFAGVKRPAAAQRPSKSIDLSQAAEFKQLEEGNGGFSGYLSPFGKLDSYADIPLPGCYAKTIGDMNQDWNFLRDGWLAPDHDWGYEKTVGFWESAREDAVGLFVTAQYFSSPDAQKIRTKVAERVANRKSVKLSIGYELVKFRIVTGTEAVKYLIKPTPEEVAICEATPRVRLLEEIKLYEGSFVSVPAAIQAGVITAKGHGPMKEFKGELLGEWVETSICLGAIDSGYNALWWYVWEAICDNDADDLPWPDRRAFMMQAFDEFRDLSMTVFDAIMAGEAVETPEDAKDFMMAMGMAVKFKRDHDTQKIVKTKTGGPQAGLPLDTHSEMVLAAVGEFKARLVSIKNLRTKEGRMFSQANQDRILAHADGLVEMGDKCHEMAASLTDIVSSGSTDSGDKSATDQPKHGAATPDDGSAATPEKGADSEKGGTTPDTPATDQAKRDAMTQDAATQAYVRLKQFALKDH